MKKLLMLLILVIGLFHLTSCSPEPLDEPKGYGYIYGFGNGTNVTENTQTFNILLTNKNNHTTGYRVTETVYYTTLEYYQYNLSHGLNPYIHIEYIEIYFEQ